MAVLLFLGACNGEKDASVTVPPADVKSAEALPASDALPAAESTSEVEPQNGSGIAETPAEILPPQIISLKLEPTLVFPGTLVKAVVEASDPQDDVVTFDYSWARNGEPLADEYLDELDTSELLKGDVITALVTPVSNHVKGEGKRSRPLVILNRPPEISSEPTPEVEEGVFTYAVTAIDPDGDALKFALEEAPSGMKIAEDSGLVDWHVPPGYDGKVKVRIVVSDGDARAFQSFEMTVTNK
jgi:hypothetical protein